MNSLELIQSTITKLNEKGIKYCLVGGIVANIYRTANRVTTDIDFAVYSEKLTASDAKEVIESLGLKPVEVREAELKGGPQFLIKSKTSPIQIIVGRNKEDQENVDLLLPSMAWVKEAVMRAQSNLHDIGLKNPQPVMTIEDLIIAKLYSYNDKSTRIKDLNDLTNILESRPELDNKYLATQVKKFKLKIPEVIKNQFHYEILRQERKNQRQR